MYIKIPITLKARKPTEITAKKYSGMLVMIDNSKRIEIY